MFFAKFYLIAIFAVGLFNLALPQTNYCASNLCNGGLQHIACGNNGAFSRSCAADARIVPMTSGRRSLILRRHNFLRNNLAGGVYRKYQKAVRMASMSWSNELAKLAELNVKRCKMDHDQCRNTKQFQYSGQNLAGWSSSGNEYDVARQIKDFIQSWFNEKRKGTMQNIRRLTQTALNNRYIGHFTAMVQDKSYKVGCAFLVQSSNNILTTFFACNYAYTNIIGKPVYQSGPRAASQCRTGRHKKYRNMCSINEKYNVNNP